MPHALHSYAHTVYTAPTVPTTPQSDATPTSTSITAYIDSIDVSDAAQCPHDEVHNTITNPGVHTASMHTNFIGQIWHDAAFDAVQDNNTHNREIQHTLHDTLLHTAHAAGNTHVGWITNITHIIATVLRDCDVRITTTTPFTFTIELNTRLTDPSQHVIFAGICANLGARDDADNVLHTRCILTEQLPTGDTSTPLTIIADELVSLLYAAKYIAAYAS